MSDSPLWLAVFLLGIVWWGWTTSIYRLLERTRPTTPWQVIGFLVVLCATFMAEVVVAGVGLWTLLSWWTGR